MTHLTMSDTPLFNYLAVFTTTTATETRASVAVIVVKD